MTLAIAAATWFSGHPMQVLITVVVVGVALFIGETALVLAISADDDHEKANRRYAALGRLSPVMWASFGLWALWTIGWWFVE